MSTLRKHFISFATAYAKQSGDADEFVIPEDLTELSDEDLSTLHDQALANFDSMYGDGTDLTDEDYSVLSDLTEGIERLSSELTDRETAATERAEKAAELAARVRPSSETDSDEDSESDEEDDSESDETDDDETSEDDSGETAETSEDDEAKEPELIAASASPVRIPMSRVRSRANRTATTKATEGEVKNVKDVLVASGDGLGKPVGVGIDFHEAGAMLDRRLQGFNARQYANAAASGRQVREQHALLALRRPIPEDLQIKTNDPEHVREVFDRAANESRLPGGSLVASGGWCAPSQVIYDIVGEVESRDGRLSIPEIGVPRGGLSFTTGPDFADLYDQVAANAFRFTEADDVAGNYAKGTADATSWTSENAYSEGDTVAIDGDVFIVREAGTSGTTEPDWDAVALGETVSDGGATWEHIYQVPNVDGDKPCFTLDCPEFDEYRLDVDGLCVSAGILQQRGFPEVLARSLRGVLVAHDHLVNGHMIAQMAAGSTKVNMTSTQAGATAPVLTAIELQVEHYRYVRRMSRNTTLEAVFPYWILGAIRADLARRQGVDLIDVPDSRILGWMRARGVNPQFVYNWQALSGSAASVTSFPSTVKFLLYSAGTWVRGSSDIITLDTIYDSVGLGQNNYTALFTEEGWFVAKRGQDSRQVSIPMALPGVVAAAKEIAWNGTSA